MEDLEFDNWVDQVYGFMHFLNLLKWKVPCPGPSLSYLSDAIDTVHVTNITADKTPLTYDLFPQSDRSH